MAARAPAVTQGIVLPPPPEKYDVADQRETRRLIMQASPKTPTTWDGVTSIPAPIVALGSLTGASDTLAYFTGVSAMALAALTPYARTIIASADAAAARTILGVYSSAAVDALLVTVNARIANPRQTVTITTASLAPLASEATNKVTTFYGANLLTIQADRACWVRLYATDGDQTADAARLVGVIPTAGIGLLAEFVFAAAGIIHVSPVAVLSNDETSIAKRVWYTVMNQSAGSSTVVITLGFLPLET